MKFLVASDIHGSLTNGRQLLERFELEKADKLVLLGDLYYHGIRNPLTDGYDPLALASLLNNYKESIFAIKGNCDSEVDETVSEFKLHYGYADISLPNGKKQTVTHGHLYNPDNLPDGCGDIFLFGHIHTGFLQRLADGRIIGNPGSVSLPKNGTPKSYITIDEYAIALKTLEGIGVDCIKF